MARLPVVDGDEDNWGSILREFLLVEHDTDGTLKRLNQASGICPLDSNSLVPSANLGLKGGYSAIVYIDGTSVITRDYKGDLIASGTAGTDDYSVLQAAINNQSGLIKVISDLTLTNKVEPASNIILDFRGQTIKSATTNNIIQRSTEANNITIIGGIFDSQNNYGTPLAFWNVTGLRIIDVEVKNVSYPESNGGYGIYIEDCDDVWVSNPKITNIDQRDGIQFKGVHNGWVVNANIDTVNLYGIDCHDSSTSRNCENIFIVNPRIYKAHYGIHLADSSTVFYVLNPEITESTEDGIFLKNDMKAVFLIFPFIYNSGRTAINTYNATGIECLQIVGGLVDTTNSGDALYLKNITRTQIFGLSIQNAGGIGINVQNDDVIVDAVEVKGSASHGIYIAGKQRVRVVNSVLKNNGGYGIREYTGSDNNVIELNEFSGNTSGAVYKVGSNTKVQNNIGYVTENEGSAIIASGNTSVTVNHGLADTPTNIQLTGTHSEVKDAYATNLGATSFDIKVDSAVSADRTVYWKAKI